MSVLSELPVAVVHSDNCYQQLSRSLSLRYEGFAHPMRLAYAMGMPLWRAYKILRALAADGLVWEVELDHGMPWYALTDRGMDRLLQEAFSQQTAVA